ncbi:tetratricopeptide repeat protein [Leptolyngbya iicbica]|nr:tetratricopeptide repeat protein [Leptolyngbya sp. LK]
MTSFASRVLGISLLWGSGAIAVPLIATPALAQTAPLEQQLNMRRHEFERNRERQKAERFLEVADRELAWSRMDGAIAAWQAALDIYSSLGDQAAMHQVMELLTKTLLAENRFAEAETVIQQQLTLAREQANDTVQMNALNNLGVVYLQLGQFERGTTAITAALDIAEALDDPAGLGRSRSNLGLAARLSGDLEAARDQYETALLYRTQTSDQVGLANSYNSLGAVYRELGNDARALVMYQRARETALEETHLPTLLPALDGLIGIYADREDIGMLQTYVAERNVITPKLAPPEQQLGLYIGLGRYYALLEDYPRAQTAYEEALVLAEVIGAASKRTFVLNQLQDLALLNPTE